MKNWLRSCKSREVFKLKKMFSSKFSETDVLFCKHHHSPLGSSHTSKRSYTRYTADQSWDEQSRMWWETASVPEFLFLRHSL